MTSWTDIADSSAQAFRRVLGSFMTGVTVVACRGAGGDVRAFTANSFTSVSLEPALVLVCLLKSSPSVAMFATAKSFSISILQEQQRDISKGFASRDPEIKAASARSLIGELTPYVADSLAVLECAPHQTVDAGDHIILLGRVQRFIAADGTPLGFFRGAYVGVDYDIQTL
ncbi:flavin reductase family protein [Caballeronia sp. GAWG2-1]|uniref:flavin reductase family protein n=1 Tax=Caballeronia sp. GAWG2-1 TaxID=2921744 RepID=UPI002028168C|nr:flavin reductase family protein [Caballeronia sp. GAWG2-1]